MLITRLKIMFLALLLAVAGPGLAYVAAGPAGAATAASSCTHTSSGSCIRGGEFCPQSKYGQIGLDAQGRRYKCTGSSTHPHWETTSTGSTTHKHHSSYHGHTLSAGDAYGPDGRYKPHTAALSGDATLTMYKSHWSTWTKKHAVGRGIGHVNNCVPDCADGHIAKIKMKLVESSPRNYCGKRYFTHYRVTFSRKPDKYTPRSYTLVRRPIECG